MSPGTKSSTAIVAGQIASALIGFALGVVVTLLAVVDWVPAAPRPAAATATPAPAPAPAPAIPAPSAAAAPPAAAPVTPPAAAPVTPPEAHAAAATPAPAAPPPDPVPAPVAVPPPSPEPPAVAAASPPAAVEPPVPVPAAKPAKPKPASPSPARARFIVQAGAFVNEEIAGKVATRLTEHDRPAEVLVRTDDSGRAWNVVRLTEIFASRDEAERVANTLKRDRDVDTLIIRLPPVKPDDAAKDAAKGPDKPGAAEAPP